jgi:hypothetical protein
VRVLFLEDIAPFAIMKKKKDCKTIMKLATGNVLEQGLCTGFAMGKNLYLLGYGVCLYFLVVVIVIIMGFAMGKNLYLLGYGVCL